MCKTDTRARTTSIVNATTKPDMAVSESEDRDLNANAAYARTALGQHCHLLSDCNGI
jgi:hypothetical protein